MGTWITGWRPSVIDCWRSMPAGCNLCGPIYYSPLARGLWAATACAAVLQSLPVSCHFRDCKAPLFKIVSGAIKWAGFTLNWGALELDPLSWDGRRGWPQDTRTSPTYVLPRQLAVLRQRALYAWIKRNPQNWGACDSRPLGMGMWLTS